MVVEDNLLRGSNRRPLKSLSEMFRGKQGRFQSKSSWVNVLIIQVVQLLLLILNYVWINADCLKLWHLNSLNHMFLQDFLEREMAPNLRVAKRMVEDLAPEVWDVLEDVVKRSSCSS